MDEERDARRRWMAVLARAPRDELERLWEAVADKPDLTPLKPAETGLVMVRARTGGSGAPFNLGEMTVTRCVLQAPGHELGHGYVAGRDLRHAELAAAFDAMLQSPSRRAELLAQVIEPLAAAQHARRARRWDAASRTQVEFLTMARER
jgi:alpha-D-ribose 1-methylphosphonate 5-triphosphate synthase subunit PhnG